MGGNDSRLVLERYLSPGCPKGAHMATFARAHSYVTGSHITGTDSEIETLKVIAIFCGAGLLVSLLCVLFFLSYGLDLGPGFF